ncbi:uncharacterized protein LOC127474065 [Manacus candei]|uniref:uncharacterized protein LOC127474065 n=1 Tax=Manacus candei TaxID=415023 RepID=UPI002226D596|nr:uncharacterized protein LOC127474065 [Manacus candei]
MRSRKRDAVDHVVSEGGRARGSGDACAVTPVQLQRSPLDLRAGSGGTGGAAVSRLSRGVHGGNNVKIFGAKAQKLARVVLRVKRGTGSRERPGCFRGRTTRTGSAARPPQKKDGGAKTGSPPRPYTKMAAPARKFASRPHSRRRRLDRNLAQATLKMTARGPLTSERRLSCSLTSAPTRTPARSAVSPRLFPGAGGRFAGGGRHRRGQPPLGAAAQAQHPRQSPPARPSRCVPLRSVPLPVCPAVPRRCCLPPPEATHCGRSDVGLCRRSSPGAGKIVDLGPAMPNVLGCEQPKATGSSPTDWRWGHLVLPVGWGSGLGQGNWLPRGRGSEQALHRGRLPLPNGEGHLRPHPRHGDRVTSACSWLEFPLALGFLPTGRGSWPESFKPGEQWPSHHPCSPSRPGCCPSAPDRSLARGFPWCGGELCFLLGERTALGSCSMSHSCAEPGSLSSTLSAVGRAQGRWRRSPASAGTRDSYNCDFPTTLVKGTSRILLGMCQLSCWSFSMEYLNTKELM